MSAPEWTDETQAWHDTIVGIRLDDEDVENLAALGYTVDDYHDLYTEAFEQRRDDPNNELYPEERHALRDEFFALMEDLGYDMEHFRWEEWREHMGY